MKIGILYNCQHESLRVALGALLPGTEMISFDLSTTLRDESLRPRIAAVLAECDHVVTINVASGYGPLSTAVLRGALRSVHLVPSLQFSGLHPDSLGIMLDGAPVGGPTGQSHSRIAVAGYLAGLSPRDTADLFNRLSFSRLGYLHAFAEQKALLLEHYAQYGIDLRAPFESWIARGCFMHDVNHPRMRVMLDLARAACAKAGLQPLEPAPEESSLHDPLAAFAIHPVFPDIAAAIGIPPSGAFRGPLIQGAQTRIMGTEAFVRASHESFARLPLAILRNADGVREAMAALELRQAPRRRPAAPAPGPDTMAFLTWHGQVLGSETASSMLMQRDFLPDEPDSVDLLVELPGGNTTAPVQANMMGGVEIAAVGNTGGVSFRRGGKFLCVAPAATAARFDRDGAHAWESFLALPVSDLANLRAIAAGNWIVEGEKRRIPSSVIRLAEGFKFAVGDLIVDLRRDRPVAQARPNGTTAYRIASGSQSLTLLPDRTTAGRDEQLLQPIAQAKLPGEIATPEEFRVARNAKLRLQGGPEILYPPLTACDADRHWTHKRYFDETGEFHMPGPGRRPFHATLIRGSNKLLMLGRSVEGIMLDDDGLVKDAGFLVKPSHMPPSIRAVGNARLLDLAATRDAPDIDGPVAVFYNPNLQNYYHWVSEALLTLHIMTPFLPPATRLVLPGTLAEFRRHGRNNFDHARFLSALGFGQFPTIELRAPFARLRDAIWIESDSVFGMPADLLQSFRARALAMHPPGPGPRRRLYIKRTFSRLAGNSPALENLLKPHGFETVVLENMPAAAQIELFTNAEFVVAVHGSALANMLFCPPGTKILEITPDSEFRPYFWLFAEKLGLPYGVLPCPTADKGFNGTLKVDTAKFRALFRMLRAIET